MDTADNRRARLRWLTDVERGYERRFPDPRLSQADLARLANKSPSYIHRLRLDRTDPNSKNMGEDVAREIEAALGLQKGWFDLPVNDDGFVGIREPLAPYGDPMARLQAILDELHFLPEQAEPVMETARLIQRIRSHAPKETALHRTSADAKRVHSALNKPKEKVK